MPRTREFRRGTGGSAGKLYSPEQKVGLPSRSLANIKHPGIAATGKIPGEIFKRAWPPLVQKDEPLPTHIVPKTCSRSI
jgi:hypothetical protein